MSPDVRRTIARLTAQPTPARMLLRTLRRKGLRLRAYFERPEEEHDNGWRYRLGGTIDTVAVLAQHHEEWERHKETIRQYLRAEWNVHQSGIPYCSCGAVGDTPEALYVLRGEAIDLTDPTLRQCITCHPELEEIIYG